MIQRNKVTCMFILSLISAVSMQASVQRAAQPAFRGLVNRLILSSNLPMLEKLLRLHEQRAANSLRKEHLHDTSILQEARKIIIGAKSVGAVKQQHESLAAYWDQLERLQAYLNSGRVLFLESVTGCERVAFVNVMVNRKLSVAELEKARLLYEKEDSANSKAMAEWLSVKIDSKKLKAEIAAVDAVINKKEAQSTRLHALDAIDERVRAHLLKRDLERKQAQLDCLYAELKK